VLAAILTAAAGFAAQSATSSPGMLVGIFDEPHTLYGSPEFYFPILKDLHAQVLRVNLYWGGRYGVARRKPFDGADPADPAYDWHLYDRTANFASQYRIKILFSIYGTPAWANGGHGLNHKPVRDRALEDFAYAAAIRYSGTYPGADGRPLPAVRLWLAWNEPNNPVFLAPQFARVQGKWVIESARDYTDICSAIYTGIHATTLAGEQVACGGTAPRGNNSPTSSRPSVSPVVFLRALKAAGLRRFDAYAHHPYYGSPKESPTTIPPAVRGAKPTAVTLANIGTLISELTRLYGRKRLWITEYGYQTNPPDLQFGVSWDLQAQYVTQAFGIARRNPRIDMMLWFMVQDEPILSGWQSGFLTADGKKKPSYAAFQALTR
jgi:hypothetical protein